MVFPYKIKIIIVHMLDAFFIRFNTQSVQFSNRRGTFSHMKKILRSQLIKHEIKLVPRY